MLFFSSFHYQHLNVTKLPRVHYFTDALLKLFLQPVIFYVFTDLTTSVFCACCILLGKITQWIFYGSNRFNYVLVFLLKNPSVYIFLIYIYDIL